MLRWRANYWAPVCLVTWSKQALAGCAPLCGEPARHVSKVALADEGCTAARPGLELRA
jgi:hypothetical protein